MPPFCLLCGGDCADSSLNLCMRCAGGVQRIDAGMPVCSICGVPSVVRFPGGRCMPCTRKSPPFDRAVSAVRYAGPIRQLFIYYKFLGDRACATPLVRFAHDGFKQLEPRGWCGAAAIVPVPSHRRRVRVTGRAPVRELSMELSEMAKIPFRDAWLSRSRLDPPQGSAGVRSREKNVRGAFVATGSRSIFRPRSPAGLRILLVDDIYTSGSTARECASELRRAGAAEVSVLTIARGGIRNVEAAALWGVAP